MAPRWQLFSTQNKLLCCQKGANFVYKSIDLVKAANEYFICGGERAVQKWLVLNLGQMYFLRTRQTLGDLFISAFCLVLSPQFHSRNNF